MAWELDAAKAYAQKVKAAGFDKNMDEEDKEDSYYYYMAENNNGMKVTISCGFSKHIALTK
ncbi:hypothetical protein FACS189415_1270 [Bacteroidia bacterium]|nr:hypothetical protein FACS189415_1270 [Bacteroidia bacterium]